MGPKEGETPWLLRNSGFAFVPNPLIYGPCRPSTLSHYVAYKFARRTGPCLRVLHIENPSAPGHPMLKEDAAGLPVKLTRKEQQGSPSKWKATGKRTGDDRHQELRQKEWSSNRKQGRKRVPHQYHQTIRDRLRQKI